eukprot:TRINITY_DN11221_c0_g1_i1.p4 TRINITY_DN11221_c0_g1~~TRINITY_DN11221_c0_g1_i1.p4  ORF type:complete len:102 (-),score=12.46 TRINITY_DN11221_c0_g1_i1:363-668(-)
MVEVQRHGEAEELDADILPPPKEIKMKNPWVAVGCAATIGALCSMIYASRKGHSNMLQQSMRARVALQGVTVGIMVASSGVVMFDEQRQALMHSLGWHEKS